jgi:PleD family two-component response regulator
MRGLLVEDEPYMAEAIHNRLRLLTAADRLDDKASGFELGADDYLTSAPMSARRIDSPRN